MTDQSQKPPSPLGKDNRLQGKRVVVSHRGTQLGRGLVACMQALRAHPLEVRPGIGNWKGGDDTMVVAESAISRRLSKWLPGQLGHRLQLDEDADAALDEMTSRRALKDAQVFVGPAGASTRTLRQACYEGKLSVVVHDGLPAQALYDAIESTDHPLRSLQRRPSALRIAREQDELEHADLVLATTTAGRDALIALGVDREKVRLWHPPVARSKPPFSASTTRSGPTRIIFLGKGDAGSGLEETLHAFLELDIRESTLHFAEPPEDKLSRFLGTTHDPRIRGTGKLPGDGPRILVRPSLIEEFRPETIIGASAGLPIIASRQSSLHERLTEHTEALFVEGGSVPDLVKSLRILIENPTLGQRMGVAAANHVARGFEPIETGTALDGFLSEIPVCEGLE